MSAADNAAVVAALSVLGASSGIQVIDDGVGYVVLNGAAAERFDNLLTTAVHVGVLLERHGRAKFDAEHEARRAIAAARFGRLDMVGQDRRVAAAKRDARKAGRRGGHDSR